MNTPQTPDYGEPWKMLSREVGDFTTHPTPHDVNNKQVCDPYRNGLVEDCQKRAERIIACVNACAGMSDPAAEIEAMREAIKVSYESLTKANDLLERAGREYETTWEPGQSWIFWEDKCSAKNDVVGIRQTLTKLKSFINHDLRHTTH